MRNVLVVGAGGQIARHVVERLLDKETIGLSLYLRHADRLPERARHGTRVFEADVFDDATLRSAIRGQDLVYGNLTGDDIDEQAEVLVGAMRDEGVGRLVFVTSLGIYDEVPGAFGAWNRAQIGAYLPPFRRAADIIEASGLDYTVLRPAWLTDGDEVDYEVTEKGEPFKGTEVSRRSVADLVVRIVESPHLHSRANLGVDKPGTEGPKPAFM